MIDGIELEGKEYLSVNNEYISSSQKNGDGFYSITLGEHDFIGYTYDENGEINGYEAWDKKGDFSDSKSSILENGTEIRGGNLKE